MLLREKQVTCEVTGIRVASKLSPVTLDVRRKWRPFVLKENNFETNFLSCVKL